MARLTDLPNELFHKLFKLADPDTLERLARTTKHIYAVAQRFLAEHWILKRKWSVISNAGKFPRVQDVPNEISGNCLANALSSIIQEPGVVPYVKGIRLDMWHDRWNSNLRPATFPFVANLHLRYDQKYYDLFKGIISSNILPQYVERSEVALKHGCEGIIVGLLIKLLPELKILTLKAVTGSMQKLFENMIAGSPPRFSDPVSLSHLAVVKIRPYGYEADLLRQLALFASLPSIKILDVELMHCCDRLPLNPAPAPRSSMVSTLRLHACIIKPDRLSVLMQRFKSLKSMTFTFPEKNPGYKTRFDCDLEGLCTVINFHAADSLEYLCIDTTVLKISMGSLRDLKVLRTLSLDFAHFVKGQRNIPTSLVSSLPSSIETISLTHAGYVYFSDWSIVLSEILSEKTSRLPNLKLLELPKPDPGFSKYGVIDSVGSVVSWFQRTCQDAGFELKVVQ